MSIATEELEKFKNEEIEEMFKTINKAFNRKKELAIEIESIKANIKLEKDFYNNKKEEYNNISSLILLNEEEIEKIEKKICKIEIIKQRELNKINSKLISNFKELIVQIDKNISNSFLQFCGFENIDLRNPNYTFFIYKNIINARNELNSLIDNSEKYQSNLFKNDQNKFNTIKEQIDNLKKSNFSIAYPFNILFEYIYNIYDKIILLKSKNDLLNISLKLQNNKNEIFKSLKCLECSIENSTDKIKEKYKQVKQLNSITSEYNNIKKDNDVISYIKLYKYLKDFNDIINSTSTNNNNNKNSNPNSINKVNTNNSYIHYTNLTENEINSLTLKSEYSEDKSKFSLLNNTNTSNFFNKVSSLNKNKNNINIAANTENSLNKSSTIVSHVNNKGDSNTCSKKYNSRNNLILNNNGNSKSNCKTSKENIFKTYGTNDKNKSFEINECYINQGNKINCKISKNKKEFDVDRKLKEYFRLDITPKNQSSSNLNNKSQNNGDKHKVTNKNYQKRSYSKINTINTVNNNYGYNIKTKYFISKIDNGDINTMIKTYTYNKNPLIKKQILNNSQTKIQNVSRKKEQTKKNDSICKYNSFNISKFKKDNNKQLNNKFNKITRNKTPNNFISHININSKKTNNVNISKEKEPIKIKDKNEENVPIVNKADININDNLKEEKNEINFINDLLDDNLNNINYLKQVHSKLIDINGDDLETNNRKNSNDNNSNSNNNSVCDELSDHHFLNINTTKTIVKCDNYKISHHKTKSYNYNDFNVIIDKNKIEKNRCCMSCT